MPKGFDCDLMRMGRDLRLRGHWARPVGVADVLAVHTHCLVLILAVPCVGFVSVQLQAPAVAPWTLHASISTFVHFSKVLYS